MIVSLISFLESMIFAFLTHHHNGRTFPWNQKIFQLPVLCPKDQISRIQHLPKIVFVTDKFNFIIYLLGVVRVVYHCFFFPAVGILKIKISSRSSPFRNIIFRVGAPRFRIHMIYFLNNSLYHFSIHQMFYDVYIGVLRAIQNCFVATRRRTMWWVCGRVGVYIRHASIDRREREISVGLYSIHDRPQTQSLTSSDVMSGTDE